MEFDSERDPTSLVGDARAGSGDARAELATRVGEFLDRYLSSSMGPGVQRFVSVADVRQEVLLGLDDLLARLGPECGWSDLEALAAKRARWAVQKAARSRRAFDGESVDGAGAPNHQAAPCPSEGAVTRADQLAALDAKIGALDEDQRQVVRLRLEEHTFEAIGRKLGIAEATARYRFVIALRKLRG